MLAMLAIALLGGLILNVMPCVLPVLALKAFSVVDHARHDAAQRRRVGLAYALGTITLFDGLAVVVLALKASGKRLGWGMQFQHPEFVAAMTAVVFAFALNALGVFDITLSRSGESGDGESFWGSYVNGLFAAILSTPCSAPFLGTAVAFALGTEAAPWQTVAVFTTIGLGLALPYVLLTLVPSMARVLPRPGAWMEAVKQVMGFLLMGTAVWLFRTLQKQVTPDSANTFLLVLVVLALALWAGQRSAGLDASTLRRVSVRMLQLAVVVGLTWGITLERPPAQAAACEPATISADPPVKDQHIAWVPYDAARLRREAQAGRPIFVDFTAEWCATCKANEKAFLETDTVRAALLRTGVVPMRADMTNESPELEKWLEELGRSGIPVYLIVMPDGSRDLLPQIITADLVAQRLDAAAQRFPRQGDPTVAIH